MLSWSACGTFCASTASAAPDSPGLGKGRACHSPLGGLSDQLSDDRFARARTPADVRGRFKQVRSRMPPHRRPMGLASGRRGQRHISTLLSYQVANLDQVDATPAEAQSVQLTRTATQTALNGDRRFPVTLDLHQRPAPTDLTPVRIEGIGCFSPRLDLGTTWGPHGMHTAQQPACDRTSCQTGRTLLSCKDTYSHVLGVKGPDGQMPIAVEYSNAVDQRRRMAAIAE